VQSDRILQGSDVQTIAQPQNLNPDPFGTPQFYFINLDIAKVYGIELSLRRATETNPGDTIFATLTITDKATSQTYSFGNQEDDFTDPTFGGIQSDTWDYFSIRNASSGSGEFDFILDNFQVEVIGSNAGLTGDFNNDGKVDTADYIVWRRSIGTEDGYNQWRSHFGASLGGGGSVVGSVGPVPEPNTIALAWMVCSAAASVGWRRFRRPAAELVRR
jgi:hypothetical protein